MTESVAGVSDAGRPLRGWLQKTKINWPRGPNLENAVMAKTKTKDRDTDRSARPDRPKPKNDAYVIMLLITFFAIVISCVLLYLDADEYGSKSPAKEVAPTLPELGKGAAGENKL